MSKGVSIHIGLNQVDPDQYGGWAGKLTACEADAKDMALLGEQNAYQVRTLLTQEATVERVTGAIAEAAGALDSGDMLFLTYSGHGGQVPDGNGDEADDYQDETWVLYDRQIVDDELYALYATFKAGVRILVLSDSCHSGTAYKLMPKIIQPAVLEERFGGREPEDIKAHSRAMPRDVQDQDYKDRKSLYDGVQASVKAKGQTDLSASLVLISGCADSQLSGDGARNGVFTARLLDVWNNGKFKGSYSGFHKNIVQGMPLDQVPQLSPAGDGSQAFLRQRPFTI